IIEEKTSRIIEVLLSAVSPFELMAGKIAGLSLAGLIVVAVYGSGGLVAANKFGVSGLINGEITALFIVYFIFGFVLLSAVFTAVGSMCNNIREAQNYNSPIMITMMIPIFSWTLISQDPNGTLAVALSFVPPITPFVMVLRIATLPQVPWLQVALTLVLLAVSVPAVVWVCARIFRTGILMYGKPPSPAEILRWVRQS
ncbi:MAG: ABC transporter permease, partial [Candidatus Glassbacteria bacterium]